MIQKTTINKIKEVASVVDVISDFYELRKSGVNYTCLCPFHDDKTIGNFVISPSRNYFKCFACGEGGNAVDFLMKHEGLSYADAIRWLGKKYSIEVDDEQQKFVAVKPSTPKPLQQQYARPLCTIPADYVIRSLDNKLYSSLQAALCRMINNAEVIRDTCTTYQLGHTTDGGVIYWQIDEQGRVRSGKIMHYDWYGHRDKSKDGEMTTWVHAILKAQGKLQSEWTLTQCLFGAHLLTMSGNEHKMVAFVEAEKTAVIAAMVYPQYLWVSCGGFGQERSGLKHEVLKGRKVVMFPDAHPEGKFYQKWCEIAEEWRNQGYDVTVSDYLERKATSAQKEAKIDIADLLEIDLRQFYIPSPIEMICEENTQKRVLAEMVVRNPVVGILIEKLNLQIAA